MSWVASALSGFFQRRRRALVLATSVVGGVYVVGKYAVGRVRDTQQRLVAERRDKENLRRRFSQNQDDCSFTTLALLPALAAQVLAALNVEDLTAALQRRKRPPPPQQLEQPHSDQPSAPAQNGTPPTSGSEPSLDPNGSAQTTKARADGAGAAAGENAAAGTGEGTEKPDAGASPAQPAQGSSSAASPDPVEPRGTPAPSDTSDSGQNATSTTSNDLDQPVAEKHTSSTESSARDPSLAAPAPPAEGSTDSETAPLATEAKPLTNGVAPEQDTSDQGEPVSEASKAPVPEAPLSDEERARLEAEKAAALAEAEAHAEAERLAAEEQKLKERQETLALWNELKVVSLSRAVASVYGIVLLTLQTHIMLNLIGRYSYLASVVSMGERPPQDAEGMEDEALQAAFDAAERSAFPREDAGVGIDPHTERLYLTFSWWLLHRGWDRLAERVRTAVESTFGQMSIMSPLSWHEFDRLLRSVRRKVEYDVPPPLQQEAYAANLAFGEDLHSSALSEVSGTTRGSRRLLAKRRTFLDVLFPTTAAEEAEVIVEGAGYSASEAVRVMNTDPALQALLNESKDLVESPDFRLVQRLALDAGFVSLRSGMRGVFGLPPLQADGSDPPLPNARFHELTPEEESMFFTSGAGKKVKLAQLFPLMAKLSKLAFQGAPNEYVEAVTNMKELRAFSAVIYSSWPKAPAS